MIGSIISNKYHILDKINQSQLSQVYLAKNIKTKNAVALKILDLKVNPIVVEEIREIFKRESQALSQLNHENIIEYLDSGIEDDQFYIVTKYLDSYNLAGYINEVNLSLEEKLQIMLKILEGIAEAHNKNILHRDLKPKNILVSDSGEVKIIDFGISKILGINQRVDQTLKDYMTIAYSSPEQLTRERLDIKSDLYSIGGILYFVLTHKDPPENKGEISRKISGIDCTDGLKQILYKALNKEAKERYSTAYEFIRDLKQQYVDIYSKSKTFYIKFSNWVANQLYDLGKITFRNKANVESFITNNLRNSSVYKGNKSYYIIGDYLKYQCRLSNDESHLIIEKVFVLDTYIQQEQEFNKGIHLEIQWTVIPFDKKPPYTSYLKELLQQVIIAKEKRDVKFEREKKGNELIKKWDRYLTEEDQLNYRKSNLGYYSSLKHDWENNRVLIEASKIDYQIENGELIQLTTKEKKQITVGVFEGIEDKALAVSLLSDININNLSSRGKIGIDTIQSSSVVKRLRRAIRTLKFQEANNKNLLEIITNPEVITMNRDKEITDFYYTNLDDLNKKAVKRALATNDFFLIQGPPGTGKTTVITEIVSQIFKEHPEAKVLLASPSHVAVDHALQSMLEFLPDKKIIRVGRSERISENSATLLMKNQLAKWIEEVKEDSKNETLNYLKNNFGLSADEEKDILNQLMDLTIDFMKDGRKSSLLDYRSSKIQERFNLIKEWHRRLNALDEFDEIFAQKASVVAATCTGIASRHVLNDMVFDWVIVDEAARATAPELLVPMIRGKKIILVGDHQQLPPIVNGDKKEIKNIELGIKSSDLEKSLFEELFENVSPEAKITLTAQFRMHPTISDMINKIFYPTTEIISKKTASERSHKLDWKQSVVWLDTDKLNNNSEQEVLNSYRNNIEAQIILKQLEVIQQKYEGAESKVKVGVISGYDAQKRLLINLIKPNDSKWTNIKIYIDNVDAFQGSETDIAIYSLVRSNNKNKIGFLSDERRLNVALSRGKTCLIIVGNASFARKATSFRGNPFADILRYIEKNPESCLLEELL